MSAYSFFREGQMSALFFRVSKCSTPRFREGKCPGGNILYFKSAMHKDDGE